ncbi:MAG: helix-turn-helix domain-containing protein [Haloarculaceae archaeon]
MTESVSDYLDMEMECEGLLECFHGLKELDQEVFVTLAGAEDAQTVDEIATAVDRERSTAYRSVQRLVEAGLVGKRQVNYDDGGYYHVFDVADSGDVTDDLQRMLNAWYAKMGQLIGEFEEKYDDAGASTREG